MSRVPMMLRALLAAAALCASCAHVAPPASAPEPVTLRIVAFNDFHGHLERAAVMATAIRELRGAGPSAVVAAGDLVGASPIESSLLHDEPTVDILGRMGLELSSVGNHEFDHGTQELLRLQSLARYQWLAANVVERSSGRTLLPAYAIREYEGIPVAFVGVVLRTTPQIVMPSGVRGYEFRDEAAAVNALVPELRAKGAEAIVVLIHEGGRSTTPPGVAGCADFEGPIINIVKRLDRAVDLVVSGHTHEAYVCEVDGRLVTSAASYGRVLTAIDVTLDRKSRDVTSARATNHVLDRGAFAADPAIAAEVARVAALSAPRAQRVVGRITGEFTQSTNAAGESNLGDLVADAHLAAMRDAGAQVAFTNPGGLRAPLTPRAGGEVTYGQVHASQPFGNTMVAMTLTGAQVLRALESQWRGPSAPARVLQVSGLTYSWDGSRPPGSRVVAGSVRVDGVPLQRDATYRVAMNSFLAEGGDGFTVFRDGTDRVGGPLDAQALERYVAARSPRAAPPEGRITRIDR